MWQNSVTQWTPENVDSGPTLCPDVLFSLQDLRVSGKEGHDIPPLPQLQVCSLCFRLSVVHHGMSIVNEEFQK